MRSHCNKAAHDGKRPPNKYRRWLDRRSDTGNYFIFFRDYLEVMSIEEAVVAQSLINLGSSRSKDGWVRCTQLFLHQQLKLTRRQQDRILSSLKARGIIQVESRGMPPNRWVCIDVERIEIAVDSQLHRGGANITTKPRNNKHNTLLTEAPKHADLHSRAAPARQKSADVDDEDSMLPGITRHKPAAVDLDRCARLRRFASQHGWTVSKSPRRWGNSARTLRNRLGADHNQIDAVLDFIVNRDVTKPRVYDFAQLAAPNVWNWLTQMMADDGERNPTVEVTAEAKAIVKRLLHQQWPSLAREELPAAVQLSINNLKAFRAKVESAYAVKNISTFAFRVLSRSSVHSLVEEWFNRVGAYAAGKERLRLIPDRVLAVGHEDFQKWGRQQAIEYGNVKHWDKLMKEIEG